MLRRFSSSPRGFAAIAGLIIFGFLLIAIPPSSLALIEEAFATQQTSPSTGGSLLIAGVEVKDKTIRFGDRLDVLVTLQNRGKEPITIPPNALILKNDGWSDYSGGGSGLGESVMTRVGATDQDAITLQPGDSVILTGSNTEMAVKTLGPMKAEFLIETENQTLQRELAKPNRFTVSFDIAPSALLTAAWAAKTPADRQRLQSQFRDLLLTNPNTDGWRNRFYLENCLTYLGCYALPLLESAMKDRDSAVRESAVKALFRVGYASSSLNFVTNYLIEKKQGQDWAASVGKCDETQAVREAIRLAIAGLSDQAPLVRAAAITILTYRAERENSLRGSLAFAQNNRRPIDERMQREYDSIGLVDPAISLVRKLTIDADSVVRAAAQKFLSNFAEKPDIADNVASSLNDPDAEVRNQALQALKSSQEPPPLATIERAFEAAKGETALGLIELMVEREDHELASRLSVKFKERTAPERAMILTAIAGHTDDAALNLITLGLKDADAGVQRLALMRLLDFPAAKVLPLLKGNSTGLVPELRDAGADVQKELESRTLFPFLARPAGTVVENTFPSREGTQPMVSSDGKWVAYVETGWGRPGGTGGFGGSNLISLVHIVRNDGTADRVVSDMFLVGWMSDSQRLASTRDGFAAIVDVNGKIVSEFGEKLDKPYGGRGFGDETWPTGNLRHQLGVRMPHTRIFRYHDPDPKSIGSFDWGHDAAFSPDGKWFGPRLVNNQWQFVDADGQKIEVKRPEDSMIWGLRAVWSPDGSHIILFSLVASNSFGGEDKAIETRKALVIDFAGQRLESDFDIDQVPRIGDWDYRQGRWNPWSRDGKRLTFIRQGQIWIADADGENARQVTFDASNKVFPTFSPDGTKIAYLTWQFDYRERNVRLGPTNLWVVDCNTGLAARITRAAPDRIDALDWLDNTTLIFNRLGDKRWSSTLKKISLK